MTARVVRAGTTVTADEDYYLVPAEEWQRSKVLAAKARRNELARERRTPGDGFVAQAKRQVQKIPEYTRTGQVSLEELADLVAKYNHALDEAVIGFVGEDEWSWAMVGKAVGITRSAAQKKWGGQVKSRRPRGGQPAELR